MSIDPLAAILGLWLDDGAEGLDCPLDRVLGAEQLLVPELSDVAAIDQLDVLVPMVDRLLAVPAHCQQTVESSDPAMRIGDMPPIPIIE